MKIKINMQMYPNRLITVKILHDITCACKKVCLWFNLFYTSFLLALSKFDEKDDKKGRKITFFKNCKSTVISHCLISKSLIEESVIVLSLIEITYEKIIFRWLKLNKIEPLTKILLKKINYTRLDSKHIFEIINKN